MKPMLQVAVTSFLTAASVTLGAPAVLANEDPLPSTQNLSVSQSPDAISPVIPNGGSRIINYRATKTSQGIQWHPWDKGHRISDVASLVTLIPKWARIHIVLAKGQEKGATPEWRAARNFARQLHQKLELRTPILDNVMRRDRLRPAQVIVEW